MQGEENMQTIRKWGNSLAIRIPMALASQLNVTEDSTVECSVVDGQLLVKPVNRKPKYLLCDLLAGINSENRHEEIDTGEPRGGEVW
jgi:antitoxin MazE